MRLSSVNIAKLKRLSIKDVKLPEPEIETPPETIEDYTPIYSQDVSKVKTEPINDHLYNTYPLVKEIVTLFNAERVELPLDPHELKRQKLFDIAKKAIGDKNISSKEDIIKRIKDVAKVSDERAEIGFNLMLQEVVLEPIPGGGKYYISGFTPF